MVSSTTILAIESSCDDTSVAIMRDNTVLSNVISSQHFHSKWGGVIPELASRAHVENISHVLHAALDEARISLSDVTAIACTTQPGLMGALLVGSSFAKGLALRCSLPCIPVNHIEGHLYSAFLESTEIQFPFIALVVSGGHTSLFFVRSFTDYDIIGSTRDDAAGEAFDKAAKLLGLSYPGGAEIDRRARSGNATRVQFPRALINDGTYEFSFSGLKTALRNHLQKNHPHGYDDAVRNDLCAAIQESIVDVLVAKTDAALREYAVSGVVIAGGVSANSRLRERMTELASKRHVMYVAPRMTYSLDNAAMIAFVAQQKLQGAGADAFRSLTFEVNSQAMRMHRHSQAQR